MPEGGPVVQQLGNDPSDVRVLASALELDDRQAALRVRREQVDGTRSEIHLATEADQRAKSQVLGWEHLGMRSDGVFQSLLGLETPLFGHRDGRTVDVENPAPYESLPGIYP